VFGLGPRNPGLSESSGVHGSLGIAADFAASIVGGGP
jgi:hypothetical protein